MRFEYLAVKKLWWKLFSIVVDVIVVAVAVVVGVKENNSLNDDLSFLDHQFLSALINQLFMWK